MIPEIDPAQADALAQQAQQQQPAADAGGSGAMDVAGTVGELVTDGAVEGIFDAIGGIFSIFD